ncbi:MAG TPA: TlpA disulfide reductase family protein [Rhodocyclaceae bacterium]|nr:TlpA disulfide reductase family protein [Rhodocyclaceae bacterium]
MGSRSSGLTEPGPSRRREALRRLAALPFVLSACGRDAATPALVAGATLPVLDLPDLHGRRVRLGGPGQPLVLNFWATWCPPCRAEMGGLDRLHRALGAASLRVVGVSVDRDLNLVREYVLQEGLAFPILWDRAGEAVQAALGVRAFPTTALVRRDGLIAEVLLGERDWDAGPARERVQALL